MSKFSDRLGQRFRESRDSQGRLTSKSAADRINLIADMHSVDVERNELVRLEDV